MNCKNVFFALLLAAGLLGCGKQPQPRHYVILPDLSASIGRGALKQAFKAIDELVGSLHRRDRITIIPILGDAQAEASGRIIRFEVPANRQAYDSDLRGFRAKLKVSLEAMEAAAVAHPGAKTDILGTIALADQEFRSGPDTAKRSLVILSDLIQEDSEVNFRRDKRLDNPTPAKGFAEHIAKKDGLELRGMPVYIGLLQSREYADLSRNRRAAIQAFWIAYFKSMNGKPSFATDGPGLLKRHD